MQDVAVSLLQGLGSHAHVRKSDKCLTFHPARLHQANVKPAYVHVCTCEYICVLLKVTDSHVPLFLRIPLDIAAENVVQILEQEPPVKDQTTHY